MGHFGCLRHFCFDSQQIPFELRCGTITAGWFPDGSRLVVQTVEIFFDAAAAVTAAAAATAASGTVTWAWNPFSSYK